MRILVRYGEIGLKSSQVKTGFVKTLRRNLQHTLDAAGIDGNILKTGGRIFAEVPDEGAADAVLSLSLVPGVVSVSPVMECGLDLDEIIETGLDVFEQERNNWEAERDPTFAVSARRAGEHDYTSKDIENELGQRIVDEHGLEVDLDDPDLTVYVEARYKNAYVYTAVVEGTGGLPIDDRNEVAVLMEDRASTVAAYLLMKRGCKVFPVYTGHEADRLEQDMNTLRQFDPGVKLTVMKGEDDAEALEQVCDLYDIDAVALSYTAEDIEDANPPDIAAELLYPVCGLNPEEVLQIYGEIGHVEL